MLEQRSGNNISAEFTTATEEKVPGYHPTLTPTQSWRILGHLRQGETKTTSLLQDKYFMLEVQGEKWTYALAQYENIPDWFAACHYRFAATFARKNKRSLSVEEALEESIDGIYQAIDQFDVSRENQFLAYAKWKMLAAIQKKERKVLGLTSDEYSSHLIKDKLTHVFTQIVGRKPTTHELQRQMLVNSKLSPSQISLALSYNQETVFLDAYDRNDSKQKDYSDKQGFNIEDKALDTQSAISGVVQSAMQRLNNTERKLIQDAFGFFGNRVTVAQLASEKSVEETVVIAQIEKVLRKLQQFKEIRTVEGSSVDITKRKPVMEHVIFSEIKPGKKITTETQQLLDVQKYQKDRVFILCKEGLSLVDIAQHLRISPSTVSTYVGHLRDEGRLPRRVSRDELMREAEKDPLTQQVKKYLNEMPERRGIYHVTGRKKALSLEASVLLDQIKQLKQSHPNILQKEIAEKLGVSKNRVSWALRKIREEAV